MDSIEGWTNIVLATSVGVGLTVGASLGWWILGPVFLTVAVSFVFWRLYRRYFGINEKEKWYYEYEIDWKNLKNLEDSKKKIENIIKDENLDSTMFKNLILTKEDKQFKIKKYGILTTIIENIEMDIAYFEYNNYKDITVLKSH